MVKRFQKSAEAFHSVLSSSDDTEEYEWITDHSEQPLKLKPVPSNVLESQTTMPWNQTRGNQGIVHGCPVKEGCICSVTKPSTKDLKQQNGMRRKYERLWLQCFERAWCICLQDRTDRMLESAEQFHKYGLCRLVQYYRPVRPSKEEVTRLGISSVGRYGCWMSHCTVAQFARQHERTAVFEDDIQFFDSLMSLKRVKALAHHIDRHLPDEWDMVKLGQFTLSGRPLDKGCGGEVRLFKTRSFGAHALIWSRKGALRLAENTYLFAKQSANGSESDVDTWMMDRFETYVCYPQLVCQSDSQTSNTQNHSLFVELIRGQVSPFLFRQQRNHANKLDFMAYHVMPILQKIALVFMAVWCLWYLIQLLLMLTSMMTRPSGKTVDKGKHTLKGAKTPPSPIISPTIPTVLAR